MRKSNSLLLASLVLLGSSSFAANGPSPKAYQAAVADAARPAADTLRDADRKPAELMAFAGVKVGGKVVELAPGGGYFTRLLSLAVGQKGHIYAYSPRPAAAIEAWAGAHPNTSLTVAPAGGAMATEPVDLVWTTLNYHDFKNVVADGSDAAAKFNKAAFAALKPGGFYLVVDHESAPGTGTSRTSSHHRIESLAVIQEVEAAGFKLNAKSDLLRHPGDDLNRNLRDAERGKTDQFVLRFVKPNPKVR